MHIPTSPVHTMPTPLPYIPCTHLSPIHNALTGPLQIHIISFTSAILNILVTQRCPKVMVGDPHQQIYSFKLRCLPCLLERPSYQNLLPH